MNLTTCIGFIDNIVNSKKLNKTKQDCRKLALFHDCVKFHTDLPCTGIQKVLESKKVQYFTQSISKYVTNICDAPSNPGTLPPCFSFVSQ